MIQETADDETVRMMLPRISVEIELRKEITRDFVRSTRTTLRCSMAQDGSDTKCLRCNFQGWQRGCKSVRFIRRRISIENHHQNGPVNDN
jgi:hypothetical protein